ncbi:MAG: glutamine synthetase [Caldilineae bacterium]|nr:MAG: glutamine synthetase [Caldilineae bacterium]
MPSDLNAVVATIQTQGIRWVRFIWTDNAGLIRAKAVHTAFLDDYLKGDGVGIAAAQQALPVMYDAPSAGSGLTPAGEVHMRADWATFTPLPYAPGHARVLTDIYDGDRPWGHCPRTFLRRAIAQGAERDLHFMAAFENEFYLLEPEGDGWAPADPTVFAQTFALDSAVDVIDEISDALEDQGVVPEMLYSESGSGQFEMPVRYADALAAADQQIVFRETVRAVANDYGFIASFVPKIFADKAGNGAHLHISLWQGDRNLTADPEHPDAISAEAAAFAAGILRHLPALMAFTTPSTNSYRRILPRFWSGAYTCWGYGNREAAIRVPQPPAGRPITNLELKTVDPTCNPYLALGAVIVAGLDGLEKDMSPGDPVQMDPADLPEEEREAKGIRRLPENLGQAIQALEQDQVLLDALEPDLARSFLAVRRAEWEGMKDLSHEEEVRLLLERY